MKKGAAAYNKFVDFICSLTFQVPACLVVVLSFVVGYLMRDSMPVSVGGIFIALDLSYIIIQAFFLLVTMRLLPRELGKSDGDAAEKKEETDE